MLFILCLMEWHSCMAAKVAIIATIAMGMMCHIIVGTVRNNRNPVNLLAIV